MFHRGEGASAALRWTVAVAACMLLALWPMANRAGAQGYGYQNRYCPPGYQPYYQPGQRYYQPGQPYHQPGQPYYQPGQPYTPPGQPYYPPGKRPMPQPGGKMDPGKMDPNGMDPGMMDPGAMDPGAMDPGAMDPGAGQNGQPGAGDTGASAAGDPSASLASASGAASAPGSVAPNSIGDFISSPSAVCFSSPHYCFPMGSPGRGRRFRIADNQNPLPQCRVFFNYNHFNNALVVTDEDDPSDEVESFDVNRYVFGAESTFWCGAGSIQIQVPFSSTLASDLFIEDEDDFDEAAELDNISLVTKFLIHRSCCTAVSAGVAIDLPTAEDVAIEIEDDFVEISNDTVILHPYVAVLHTPSCCTFWQFYAQLSLPAGENDFFIDADGDETSGELDPGSFLHLDFTYGFWWYRNPCACHLKGIAPMVELHYTRSIDIGDEVDEPDVFIASDDVSYLNLTVGCEFLVGCTAIRPAVVVPLSGDDNDEDDFVRTKPFDWEFVLQVNRFF